MIPRHELWRRQYREQRYARHLDRPELNQRIRDVFLNILLLNEEAKIGVVIGDADAALWWEKWTHVLEEMVQRYGPYPHGFDRDVLHTDPLPDFTSGLAEKAAAKMASLGLKAGEVLIKFGQPQYMEALLCEGRLRIQPASYFSNPTHNGAIRDDELNLPISVALSGDMLRRLVINPQDLPADPPDHRFDVTFSHSSDYWLYCVSTSVQPRLFVDFGATACVIIRDREVFQRRFAEAAKGSVNGAKFIAADANYIDPLLPPKKPPFIPFAKHFRYSYQREYRYCWMPSERVEALSHLDIALGPLDDIAELVTLD